MKYISRPELDDFGNELVPILKKFQPITLEEMDSVMLMSRMDVKYYFHASILKNILEKASKYYKILEIKNQRQFQYLTTYFDTPDFRMYQDHHNGKLNRYKIRQRHYVLTGTEFFEVKHKTNKGWTLKSRIRNDNNKYLNEITNTFLKDNSPYSNSVLHQILVNDFVRITLVNNIIRERATLDYGIAFSNFNEKSELPHLGVVEIKQDFRSDKSILLNIMRDFRIKPDGISKYCIGVATLCKGLKTNMLKQKIRKINKII